MSIILSMISKNGGVVSSDGRKHSSIVIKADGTSDEKSIAESDDYNKTFIILNKILGAYCGLLAFSNSNISEHIAQIVEDKLNLSYEEVVDLIEMEMRNKLSQISPSEIKFECRKIDLLLVGRRDKKRMQISALRFFPEKDKIQSIKEVVITDRDNKFYTFGDDKAQKCVKAVLNSNKAPNNDIPFLKKISVRAIKAGINGSGTAPYSEEKSCGGTVFSTSI